MGKALSETGIYSLQEAAKLLAIPEQRLRGWIIGYPRTEGTSIIRNELERLSGKVFLSFTNLIEARFVQHFAKAGVHLNSLRVMAEEARRHLNHEHPFATKTIFKTDGRRVFAVACEKTDDAKLYDLKAHNWALHGILADAFIKEVEYDPRGDAHLWRPRPAEAPNVVVSPKAAFGQPVLADSGVPTSALYDALTGGEGETLESIAAWFDLPVDRVREAVLFETGIVQAA